VKPSADRLRGDSDLIRQVKDDMWAWSLSWIVWVADRGFSSQRNRRELTRGAGGYIIGEKLRSGSPEVKAALYRQGRHATVKDNLQVKEVNIGTDDRFVFCFNPAQAERDAAVRARLVDQLGEAIAGPASLRADGWAKKAVCVSVQACLSCFGDR
jgi:hypothetical protein